MNKPMIGIMPLFDKEKSSLWMLPGYMEGIIRAGGIPVVLPLMYDEELCKQIAQTMDGFVFTGGQDISPGLYHEEKMECCGAVCVQRDKMETLLFQEALLVLNKPVFGICRGMQLMNVLLGGTLYQDIARQFVFGKTVKHIQSPPKALTNHKVMIKENSLLHTIIGSGEILVNTYHHQGIKELSEQLEALATAEDGIVEAVYMPGKNFALAVQWHPELLLSDESSGKLFSAFVGACNIN